MSLKRAQRMAALLLTAGLAVGMLTSCVDENRSATDRTQAARSAAGSPAPTESMNPEAETTEAEAAEPDPAQTTPARVVWSRAVAVVSQPVEAGGAVLVLTRTPTGGLEIISLDRRSGEQNFAMPFNPGGAPTGVAPAPTVTRTDAGRELLVLRRFDIGDPGPALVAVDVRTGAVVRRADRALDDYDACSDGHDVCWSGYESRIDGGWRVAGGGPTRWDLETGRLLENKGQEGARQVGTDLYVQGEGRTSRIKRLQGSQEAVWTESTSLAVRRGADPDHGWSFDLDDEADVYVGSLGRAPASKLVRRFRAGKRVQLDYSRHYLTVGIDGGTGKQLWRRKGADPWCPLVRDLPQLAARTLCVVDGELVQRQGRSAHSTGLAVTIEGVDPTSGETRWSHRLEGRDATWAYVDRKAPLAPYGIVLPGDDGPVALDLRDGGLSSVDPDAVLLCSGGPDTVTAYGTERSAGVLYRTCTPDGRVSDGRLSAFGTASLPGAGDVRFVAMPGRVVAFRT